MKYTYRDLMEYLRAASKSGGIKYNTARTRRTAINRVFASQPEYEHQDIFSIDLDDVISGFRELEENKDVSESTIETYKSRIKTTIEDFALWLRKSPQAEPGWKISESWRDIPAPTHSVVIEKSVEKFSLPIPLESGLVLTINDIPTNITEKDVIKICDVLKFIAKAFKEGGDKRDD